MSDRVAQKDWQFAGRWIGETQDCPYERPAHIWEIQQQGTYLTIDNMWEGDTGSFRQMWNVSLVPGEAAFAIAEDFRAVMVDPQHFIVAGWDTIDNEKGKRIAQYDVVFSRPGVAELTARRVWQDWKQKQNKTT